MYKEIAAILVTVLENQLTQNEIEKLLEKPKHQNLGDIAFPCFTLAKKFRKAPQIIAQDIAAKIENDLIQEVQVVGGYINLFLNKKSVTQNVISTILHAKSAYGQKEKQHQNVVVDFSSPNIAKPFSMGHLRSTVIGNALANISEKNGYDVIRINHLGDWGTQFGKLIVAYHLWGNKEAIEAAPIQELLKLYVKFHELAEEDEQLNVQARAAFKALEQHDAQALALWKWFKEASLQEFKEIYDVLNIHFDSYDGEAFYNDKMHLVIEELQQKNLLTLSDGAYVVALENMPPCLITKQDGATLYATRDLAAAIHRKKQYDPAKVFYVVGNEQTLHFKQFFNVISKMGYTWYENLQHVPFGMMLKSGKKMSTRKGRVILLKDVLNEAIETAKANIEEKNPSLTNKEIVAKQVGVGAVIFNDLKNFRLNDIEFSLEQMMNFEGETGPYVQYTFARISSILEKAQFKMEEAMQINELGEQAWTAIQLLNHFPQIVTDAFEQADPSLIAKFALQLARAFNKYYAHTKILVEDDMKESRLIFSYCVAMILQECLAILGIEAPKNM
ncbi:arginine--tRNA ligase [Lysinibacillus sp. 2017]|uniref:arginine--tRNA ligase n=1 Tax=unclassified Lysinibacillus TaxID=2636778 RepID=UPI000D52740F|nr:MULTISPECIES: arginine--tRNA ligase [unclassified Lysinibacillus]AWE07146.1 arginine--tRNA ligase [Lysinibacillus sp. 2017]TGN36935.1 arginine--tRNA ligase [Lysinibacillus sp. S2017]